MSTNEAVAFTSYRPLIVRSLEEKPLPSLGSAIAAKSKELGLPQCLTGHDAHHLFDIDMAVAKRSIDSAVNWWQVDLLGKVQPKTADFLRSIDLALPEKTAAGSKQ